MKLESVKTLCPNASVLGIEPFHHGWNSEKPEFEAIVKAQEHALIVEVGSWLGQSALRFASMCPNALVICVDTWLGSTDHMPFKLPRNYGFPDIYRQFIVNVASASGNVAERIYPMVQTSRNAAKLLRSLPFSPTLIYIDGSHEEDDCYDDACAYYKLLAPGGTLFGDDFDNPDHPGVRPAVERFCKERGLVYEVRNGFWVTHK